MTQKTQQEVINFLNSDSYQIEQAFVEPEKLATKLIEFFYGEVDKDEE